MTTAAKNASQQSRYRNRGTNGTAEEEQKFKARLHINLWTDNPALQNDVKKKCEGMMSIAS